MTTSYIQAMQVGLDVKAGLETLRTDMLTNSVNATTVQADLDATEATVITDLGVLRTAIIAALTRIDVIATALNAVATKVNAGATDCATNTATTAVATLSPAAITTA